MSFKPGLVSVTFRSLSYRQIIEIAVANELKGIEWGGDIHVPAGDLSRANDVRRASLDAGLEIVAYGSYYRVGESEQAGLSFDSVCETAVSLGAPSIRVWAGSKNSEDANDGYRASVSEDLNRIGRIANQAGTVISLEFHTNTLTNTAESALALLSLSAPEDVQTYWQPPNGSSCEMALCGLQKMLPRLRDLHVFHWWPTSRDRHPLQLGKDRWLQYLSLVQSEYRKGWALLEFVKDDSPTQLKEDARILRELLEQTKFQAR